MHSNKNIMDKHNNTHVKLCQVNINGVSTHTSCALDKYIADNNINILGLQETGTTDVVKQNLKFTNMVTYTPNLIATCKGVALCIDEKLKSQSQPHLNDPNIDVVWVTVELTGRTTLVGSAYCLPETNTIQGLQEVINNIQKALDFCRKYKIKDIIVMGDFNSRSKNWGDIIENKRGKCLMNFISKEDMVIPAPHDNTFVCANGGSVIDLLLLKGPIAKQYTAQCIDSSI